jgi:hypothetical protein
MTRRPYQGISDAQANAEALARRGSPYTAASGASFSVNWDWHRREPENLREAVRMVRRAYADEVPTKLHDGDELADDGTPKMTAKAEGYIFGRDDADDAKLGQCACSATRNVAGPEQHGQYEDSGIPEGGGHTQDCPANPRNRPLVGYYHTPFRATLANMGRGDECSRKRAAVVSHVSIGSQGPVEAAMAEGVPAWCAKTVAEDALRSFLRSMTDLRLHVQREAEAVA